MTPNPPPEKIDGATVISYAILDDDCRPTGRCRHSDESGVLGPFFGLVIARYDSDGGFYLFYCDRDWECVTDTYHGTFEDAKGQADFEYEGVTERWAKMLPL